MAFIFDANTETPASIARKREIAEALAGRVLGRAPRDVGEGLTALGNAIAFRRLTGRADKAERAGRESAGGTMARIFDALNGQRGGVDASPASAGIPTPPDAASPAGGARAAAGGPSGGNPAFRDAIASIESAGSGDYSAVGPTHPKMGRALGRYQVMEANIGPWSQAALGQAISPEQFLADPKAQDAIFDHQFGSYVDQFGSPAAAAQAWFAGPGGVGKVDRQDVLGTSVGEYGDRFMRALGQGGAPAPVQMAQAGGGTGPSVQALMEAMQNPWLDEGQRAVVQMLIERQFEASDPAAALQREKLGLEIERMRNPQMDPGEAARLGLDQQRFGFDQQKFEQEQALAREKFEADQRKLLELGAGTTVFDPQSRQPVFTAPQKPDTMSPEAFDQEMQLRRAGKAETNVTVGGEPADGALRKKLDEKTGELWSSYQQTGATSAATAQDMQIIDQLIQLAPQGPLTGRLAEMFPGFSAAGDAFQSIVKRVAPTLRAPGSGATSDIEYDGMLRSLPALRNSPEANAMISQILKAKSALNIERSGVVDAYGRGEISAGEARSRISEIDKRSIMSPEMKRALDGLGGSQQSNAPEPGAVEDGFRFKGGNPADPNSWEPVQ